MRVRVELLGHLVAGAEDVGVVLGHAPDPGQAVHHARLLVAVHRAELEEAQRQLAVGALVGSEDQDVERAVHRLEVVLLAAVQLHGREHPLGEPVEVAGGLEQLGLGDVRGVDELVAGGLVALARVVLHQRGGRCRPWGGRPPVPSRSPRGTRTGPARRRACGGRAARPPPAGRGGRPAPLRLPGRAVDALELLALLVAPPVGPGHPHQGEVAQPRRWRGRAGPGTGR